MAEPELLINMDALRSAKTLMNQKFPKIMNYYFEDTETYINTIDEGMQKQDAGIIAPAAHTIKSSSKQLGADQLSGIAFEIEVCAKEIMKNEMDISVLNDKVVSLKDLYKRTRIQMETALQGAI